MTLAGSPLATTAAQRNWPGIMALKADQPQGFEQDSAIMAVVLCGECVVKLSQ
jgi:predicted metal-binding protein